jgi:hypothetical protein
MQQFNCTNCGNRLFFENATCVRCNHVLGFDSDAMRLVALQPLSGKPGHYEVIGGSDDEDHFRFCANAAHGVCNWLLPANDTRPLCRACGLNRTVPNHDDADQREAWARLEVAKKRLIYSLLRLGLPFDRSDLPHGPMVFDFKDDAMTGHAEGVITIALSEADPVERERRREMFDEPYRSLLGHLRHESAHYFWTQLVLETGRIEECRRLFGDERADYAEALNAHYANGPKPNWQLEYISAYAGAHPWEDWAETWAHYLHMVDAVDTAEAVGMEPRSAGISFGAIWPFRRDDIYREESFDDLMERWVPLTVAMNSVSRSMGHRDFYPFVIPDRAVAKLKFVHDAIRHSSRS